MRISINMQKIRLLHWFVLEKWSIKKSCNLIGWEHFGPYLRNKNFPKYGIYAGAKQIISIFIIEQIQYKSTAKFFNKFKKPSFLPIFGSFPVSGAKRFPLENPALSRATLYEFLAPWQNLEKIHKTIPKKTHRQTEGRK